MVKHAKLRQVPPGTMFSVWGRKYTVLRQEEGKAFVLAAELAGTMPFRRSEDEQKSKKVFNDFRGSSVRDFLNGPYLDKLVQAGADRNSDILPFSIDLKSTEGQREYGFDTVSAGLLTLEQYGEFWRLIPLISKDGWWLATPFKTPKRSPYCGGTRGSTYAWYVLNNGSCLDNNCNRPYGVRPALYLNAELLVSWEEAGDGEDCPFCQSFDFTSAGFEVGTHGAQVLLSGGGSPLPERSQFRFCPACGRKLNRSDAD